MSWIPGKSGHAKFDVVRDVTVWKNSYFLVEECRVALFPDIDTCTRLVKW